ncbi:hypothetical protein INR79_21550 [Vibrio sp. SCSIO 43132]|uniref:hypothetical protein n=1 Tax=Vibrio sp. SCSIO 43132 TaxID=2779363 RepID=UPI001CAA37AE|nr:hypothetical protein [Vibrio sp. SCSIO 43132]UAB73736.1 hypothetical protein INR79_21550 [Vibrio sp. SCSIO 43132]
MKKLFILVGLMYSPFSISASDNLIANVTYTGTYGDGRFFVAFDVTINEPGCPRNRIDVAPNHPQIDRWLSIALAAHASGKPVQVRTNGCYKGYPTLDNTDASWFHSKF